jgi:hypothetical protein
LEQVEVVLESVDAPQENKQRELKSF